MKIYHGSTVIVQTPEIRKSEVFLDFGDGFYTTTSYEQAKRWAKIKARRKNLNEGFVTVYEFDEEQAFSCLQVNRFESADERWLTFVVNNRKGILCTEITDMTIGPVADDNVYQSIRLFETGAYDMEYTVKRLKTELLQDQWVFHTNEAVSFLHFVESERIIKE